MCFLRDGDWDKLQAYVVAALLSAQRPGFDSKRSRSLLGNFDVAGIYQRHYLDLGDVDSSLILSIKYYEKEKQKV